MSLSSEVKQSRPIEFYVDSGAPRFVVGRKTLNRMFTANGAHQRRIMPSRNRFQFADAIYDSLGIIFVPLLTPPRVPSAMLSIDIVDVDIPALLGMDVLDKESLTPCTGSNHLAK